MDPKARATAAVPLPVGLLAGCISQNMANKARKSEEDRDYQDIMRTNQEVRK